MSEPIVSKPTRRLTFARIRLNRELLVVAAVFIVISAMLTTLKIVNPTDQRGDTAFYEQVTENIANRGVPMSSLQANILTFVQSGLTTAPASKIASAPLAPPSVPEINVLRWHEYLIMYPVALLAKLFPSESLLLTLDVLSFTGIVVLAYLILRKKDVPILGAALFCLLIISHPAWSDGLLSGQFYPDRLFVLIGFVFMYAVSRERVPWYALVAAGAIASAVNERGALTAGAFSVAYAVLYWRELRPADRNLRIGLGVAMLAYGVLVVKLVITNFYYSTFLPTNITQIIGSFQLPGFAHNAELFLFVNAVLLIVALFEPRAALLAAVLMLPNILGNIGGAEKVGWTTHYHSYYFPALVWAAMRGYLAAYTRFVLDRQAAIGFYAAIGALIVVMSSINTYSTALVSPANITSTFVFKFSNAASTWLTPEGLRYNPLADGIAKAVPEGSVVSAPEVMMPYLFRNRTVRFFPIDIDHADYAAVSAVRGSDGRFTYGGTVTYLGPKEEAKINAVLVQRMKQHGYDFDKAVFFPSIGVAIVKRRA